MILPAPADCAALLAANRRMLAGTRLSVGDLPLDDFRRRARVELLDAAVEYTARITGKRLEADPDAPLIASGHQPEFYHTGVWVKNFLLHRLAADAGGRGLNLVVDNDALRHTALTVPRIRDGRLGSEQIPFTRPRAGIAFEEDTPTRPEAVSRLAAEISASLDTLDADSAFGEFASLLETAAGEGGTIAEVFTRARRRWETGFGIENLELPVSILAETDVFRRFVLEVITFIDRIARAYNQALAEYRRLHGITNRANPMPDLAGSDEFHELPFWIWRQGGQRQRLEAQRVAGGWEIQIDDATEAVLTHEQLARPAEGVAVLADLARRGFKIRPRALTLTWFMRLAACDLFIHGIGGAHYDTITDQILRRLYDITPPGMVVATGTLWMDLPHHDVSARTVGELGALIRELTYNPQRHVRSDDPRARELAAMRQGLIRRGDALRDQSPDAPDPAAHRIRRRELFHEIRQTNENLLTCCARSPADVHRQLALVRRQLDDERIAANREYFFALPPRTKLAEFLLPIAGL